MSRFVFFFNRCSCVWKFFFCNSGTLPGPSPWEVLEARFIVLACTSERISTPVRGKMCQQKNLLARSRKPIYEKKFPPPARGRICSKTKVSSPACRRLYIKRKESSSSLARGIIDMQWLACHVFFFFRIVEESREKQSPRNASRKQRPQSLSSAETTVSCLKKTKTSVSTSAETPVS